jgi:hypothetical protein
VEEPVVETIWSNGNIIGLTLAIIATIIVIGGIVFYTATNKQRG